MSKDDFQCGRNLLCLGGDISEVTKCMFAVDIIQDIQIILY